MVPGVPLCSGKAEWEPLLTPGFSGLASPVGPGAMPLALTSQQEGPALGRVCLGPCPCLVLSFELGRGGVPEPKEEVGSQDLQPSSQTGTYGVRRQRCR